VLRWTGWEEVRTSLDEIIDNEHVTASRFALLDLDRPFVSLSPHLGAQDGVKVGELPAESFDRTLVWKCDRHSLMPPIAV
jgi:hypothetical protein